jgi:hypothetical protein
LITSYFSKSAQREIPIADMSYSQLTNTINAYSRRIGGGTDEVLEALRADLARRPPPDQAPAGADSSPAPSMRGSGTARSRDGTKDPVADPRGLAKIGHNDPPEETVADRLRARLEAEYAAMVEEIADHELAAAKLPKVVNTDEDVAAINAWVVKARGLYRRAEDTRKAEKDDYLQAGKTIDAFFAEIKDDVAKRAKDLEDRNTPYLQAKAAREEAERRAQAEAKRKAAEEAAAAEQAALAAQRKAQEEAAAAERQIREAKDAETLAAAEAASREANRKAKIESDAAAQAAKDVAQATKSADRDEKIADGGGRHALGRTSAGGGSSSLKTEWKYRVTDRAALAATLGGLQPFLAQQAVDDALARAARAPSKPEINGVEFYPETTTQTR